MAKREKKNDGVWRLSASQLSDWKLCHRKWFYNKVMKLPPDPEAKPKYGADVGEAMHEALEIFHATGQRLSAGEKVVHGVDIGLILTHVWDHELVGGLCGQPHVLVEAECQTTIGSMPFLGYMDKHWRVGNCMYILDYKSTKQWQYAKTEQEAVYDPQTLVYAKWALEQPGITEVRFYYFTVRYTLPISKPRVLEIYHTAESLAPFIEAAAQLVEEIVAAKAQAEYRVEQNKDSCFAYGKCEYAYACWKTPTVTSDGPNPTADKKESKMSFDVKSLLQKHVARQAAQDAQDAGVSAPVAPFVPPTSPKNGPATLPPEFKKAVESEPATLHPTPDNNTLALVDIGEVLPTIYFGSQPMNESFVLLESFMDELGYMRRFSEKNKGAYYLTSDYNVGERQLAAQFAVDVYDGRVKLPKHLVVTEGSRIGFYLKLETRYLHKHAILVGRSSI